MSVEIHQPLEIWVKIKPYKEHIIEQISWRCMLQKLLIWVHDAEEEERKTIQYKTSCIELPTSCYC